MGMGIAIAAIGSTSRAAIAALTAGIDAVSRTGTAAKGAAVLVKAAIVRDAGIVKFILIVKRRRLRNDEGIVIAGTVQRIVQHLVKADVLRADADIAVTVDEQIAHHAASIVQIDIGEIIVGRLPAFKVKPDIDHGRHIGADIGVNVGVVIGQVFGEVAGLVVGGIRGGIVCRIARKVLGRIGGHIAGGIFSRIIGTALGRVAVGIRVRVGIVVFIALALGLILTLALILALALTLTLALALQVQLSLTLTLALSLALALSLTLALILVLALGVDRPGEKIHVTARNHCRDSSSLRGRGAAISFASAPNRRVPVGN